MTEEELLDLKRAIKGSCDSNGCTVCRATDSLVAEVRRLRARLSEAVEIIDHGIPQSCGACGTPNANCDCDCVAAASISQWMLEIRKDVEAKP